MLGGTKHKHTFLGNFQNEVANTGMPAAAGGGRLRRSVFLRSTMFLQEISCRAPFVQATLANKLAGSGCSAAEANIKASKTKVKQLLTVSVFEALARLFCSVICKPELLRIQLPVERLAWNDDLHHPLAKLGL